MATIRAVGSGKKAAWQAIVRKRGYSLSRVFSANADARAWSRDCERAIDQSSPDRPFDRAAWLGQAPEAAPAPDDTQPHAGWTVKRALERYGETLAAAKKGAGPEAYRIAMWKGQAMARKRLDALTVADVQGVVSARLADGLAGDTVRREVNVLRALYRDAAGVWGVKDLPDPFKGLKLPKPAPHRERRLEDGHGEGEEERLRAALAEWKCRPDVHVDLFDFSIETGLRLSEAHALTAGSVRSVGKVMRVELPDSKNGAPRRVVLSARAGEIAARRMAGLKPWAKLFPISDSARKRAWETARRKAGVQDLRWHDLRHEGISRMAGRNLHLGELMAQSGHRDAESVKRYMNARAKDIARKLG